MRLSADWMSIADDRILEHLSEEGPKSPMKIAESTQVRFSRSHINTRCQILEEYGLTQNIGNGVYQITEQGQKYLNGDLDTANL